MQHEYYVNSKQQIQVLLFGILCNFFKKYFWSMVESWIALMDMEDWLYLPTSESKLSLVCHSVQFSHSVMSNSSWPHGLQHARPLCPSPTPGVYPNSCPLSQWCHPTISSSVVSFFSCLQSFLTSGSFQMSQLFASGGQNIGVSASTLVLPMNTQDWSTLGWTGWMSLQSKGLPRVFCNTTVQNHQFFGA